jgi:putative ABC transport system ATP-binding protein
MTAVRCVDLCKTYRQGEEDIKALDHVSIEIDEGDFVCLSAPSGGGKTTLLNAIGGLDKPDSGEVYISGRRIDNLSKGELAELRLQQIGFVFQAFNLIPVLTAIENVEFVMQVQGVPSGERRKRALEILEEVGLAGLEDRRPADIGLMELFRELNDHHNTTFVIATHDKRVMSYAKRLVRMLDGRIVGDIEQDAA